MKKMLKPLLMLRLFVIPSTALLFCSWENPGMYTYANRIIKAEVSQADTLPKDKTDDLDKALKDIDASMANLDKQMKDIKIDISDEINKAIASIDFDAIQKQTEASLKQIDWDKMQQDINVSLQNAKTEMAKVDFSKLQDEMKALKEKFNSEEFKSQFKNENFQKTIDEAMANAKAGIEKAKEKIQLMKDFTDALSADGLIDKKKGYTIEWKDGDLYINNQKQSKAIADKYRKYENTGKIKMHPEGTEYF